MAENSNRIQSRLELINEKYDLYRTLPEGQRICSILDKLDRKCTDWMIGDSRGEKGWFFMKKEILVQIMEKGFADEEGPETNSSSS